MFIKIAKIVGITLILLLLLQYLVTILITIFSFLGLLFGAHLTEDTDLYSQLHALSILISFALIVYLWIKGYKTIFRKTAKKEKVTPTEQGK